MTRLKAKNYMITCACIQCEWSGKVAELMIKHDYKVVTICPSCGSHAIEIEL